VAKDWFSTGEVGRRIGTSTDTVRRECERPNSRFPGARFNGRSWRVPAGDVDGYEELRREITDRVRRGKRCKSGND
jgi:hypothetical protein